MNQIYFASLLGFAILSCATPGPNTIKLAFCSANFGFKRTLAFSNGIILGRIFLQLFIIFIFNSLFKFLLPPPVLLKCLGSLYLLYIAYCIAMVNPSDMQNKQYKPLSFIQAFIYQFLNAKVWANATTAISIFVSGNSNNFYLNAIAVIIIFAIISLLSNFLWMICGVQISRILISPNSRRYFNLIASLLSACCIYFIWM